MSKYNSAICICQFCLICNWRKIFFLFVLDKVSDVCSLQTSHTPNLLLLEPVVFIFVVIVSHCPVFIKFKMLIIDF